MLVGHGRVLVRLLHTGPQCDAARPMEEQIERLAHADNGRDASWRPARAWQTAASCLNSGHRKGRWWHFVGTRWSSIVVTRASRPGGGPRLSAGGLSTTRKPNV